MHRYSSDKIYKWGIRLLIVVFSIFVLYLNVLSPYMPGDDYMFMMKVPADGSVGTDYIGSLSDFITSQCNIYQTVHYRILAHTILQIVLLMPSGVFDVLNAVVFLWMGWLLIPRERVSGKWYLFVFVLLFLFVFHPDLANAYFWTTGAVNYSWTLIPLLYYLRALVSFIDYGKEGKSLLLLSPLVACTNENALIAVFVVTGALLVKEYFSKKKLNKTLLLTCGVLLVGGLLMIFAPSASARLSREGSFFQSFDF